MSAIALTPMDFGGRAARVRADLAANSVSALFVSNLTNIRWLTGFTGSNGWLVLSDGQLVLVTDGRYADQAAEQMAAGRVDGTVLIGSTRAKMIDHVRALLGGHSPIGFESGHLTYADHATIATEVGGSWLPTAGVVEAHRRTKDSGEVDRMRQAARLADDALAATLPLLGDEPTEATFRDHLEWEMRRLGADGPSFDTIVAAGANAALPHHHPDSTRIVEGMTVVVDFGALYDGYHSDMTRTFTIGDPTAQQQEVYEVVLAAQRAGVAAVAPGARGQALDAVCRDHIAAAGWGDWFNHGTGHGVGLQIHESPWLTLSYDDTLAVSDVVTVEPGVYRKDFGGVRIEDMVLVTTDGCQSLTNTPKDSPCLPSRPMS